MARVHLLNIDVLDNPAKFKNPLSFEITFECLEELEDGKGSCFIVFLHGKMSIESAGGAEVCEATTKDKEDMDRIYRDERRSRRTLEHRV